MPRYLIERDVAGWSDDDVEAAGLRAKLCAPWFPGLQWVVSYFDHARDELLCVYEAAAVADIEAHARFSGLPVSAIRAIEEIHPEDIEGPEPEPGAAAAAPALPDGAER